MKKLLAFLLALMMLTALFSGCSNDSDDDDDDDGKKTVKTEEIESAEDLIGTWTMRVDMELTGADGFKELKEAGFDYDYMEYEVTFDEDGKMTIDGKSMLESRLEMMEAFVKWVKKGDNFYIYAEAVMDMDEDETDAYFEQQGMTVEEAMEQMEKSLEMQKEYDAENVEDLVENYVFEDGKLYTWGEYSEKDDGECFTVGKSGKTLVVLEYITED